MHGKWYTGAALMTALGLVLTACGGAGTSTPVVATDIPPTPTYQDVMATPTPTPLAPVGVIAIKSKDPTSFAQVQANEPGTLEPSLSTDPEADEIIQNVYETLIFFKRESVTDFIPQLAEQVPTLQNGGISPDGRTYTFKIRKGVSFHNGDPLTAGDVAYTFQRNLLHGSPSSQLGMLFEPFLGATANDDITDLIEPTGTLLNNPQKLATANGPGLVAMCTRVQNLIKADNNAGTVTFQLYRPWGPFMLALASPYSSILDRKWAAQNGDWDGSCATWQNFYDRSVDQLNQTALGRGENGTGPFLLDHWTSGKEIVLKAYPNYWRKDPAWPGGPVGVPALKTVTIQFIKQSSLRLSAFKSGNADTIGFFTTGKATALDPLVGETCDLQQGKCTPTNADTSTIRMVTGISAGQRMDGLFNYSINAIGGNVFVGNGQLDGKGIPLNFFADVHIRQAFNYCFDWNAYIQQAYGGMGQQSNQVMLSGELGADPNAPHYSYDPKKCADAFRASIWQGSNGKSLWDTGFQMSLPTNPKDPSTQIFAQILSGNISSVNKKFIVNVLNVDWETYQDAYRNKKLPISYTVAHEGFPDPHFWAQLYTLGSQYMPQIMKNLFYPLVNRGAQITDPAVRMQVYNQFNQLYYDNAPAILLAQELDHRYEQRWVNGYYDNPMYADLYFYVLSKQ